MNTHLPNTHLQNIHLSEFSEGHFRKELLTDNRKEKGTRESSERTHCGKRIRILQTPDLPAKRRKQSSGDQHDSARFFSDNFATLTVDGLACIISHIPDDDLYFFVATCQLTLQVFRMCNRPLRTNWFACTLNAARMQWCEVSAIFTMIHHADSSVLRKIAEKGSIKAMKWALSVTDLSPDANVMNAAILGNNREMFEFLAQSGCPWDSGTTAAAASTNNFKLLKALRRFGCEWDQRTTTQAARVGNLKMLQWCRERGCNWGMPCIQLAVTNGRKDIVIYCIEQGCYLSDVLLCTAATAGDISMIEFLRLNCGLEWDCGTTASSSSLETLKYLRKSGCPWDGRTPAAAAARGDFEMVKYCWDSGCPFDSRTCKNAAATGNEKILMFAIRNGCPICGCTAKAAIRHGSLAMYQIALNHGCSMTPEDSLLAAEYGHVDILNFIKEQLDDYMLDYTEMAKRCSRSGFVNVLEWLPKSSFNKFTMAAAASGGNLKALKFLKALGCEFGISAVTAAAREGHLHVLKYFVEEGLPWTEKIFEIAMKRNHHHILAWGRKSFVMSIRNLLHEQD